MKIIIETIPMEQQRFNTLGDYWYETNENCEEHLHITVSKTGCQWYDYLISIHELVEVMLTEYNGIKETEILEFDLSNSDSNDPGSIPTAPYHSEHMFSLQVEKQICKFLGIDWETYDNKTMKI